MTSQELLQLLLSQCKLTGKSLVAIAVITQFSHFVKRVSE